MSLISLSNFRKFGTRSMRTVVSLMRYSKASCIGMILMMGIILIALGAPLIAIRHYAEVDVANRLKPPSLSHPFGTDILGRDVFSRVVYGARIALGVGLLAIFVETFVGIPLGIIAGYFGGKVDKIISALGDAVWAFPPIVLALGVVMLIGPGLVNVMVAIALTYWPVFARVTRAKVQSLVNREFILAARAIGESDLSIMFRYLLPNVIPVNIVLATLYLPAAILSTTALSFLGFGAQPPTPDWGLMLAEGASQLVIAPWIATFPGIFLVITALGFNLVGDGLRDLLDPKLKV